MRKVRGIIVFRLIAFGAPNGRDRRDQFGYGRSRYRASRQAKPILVPATVATAENVGGGLARVRPSGFFTDDFFSKGAATIRSISSAARRAHDRIHPICSLAILCRPSFLCRPSMGGQPQAMRSLTRRSDRPRVTLLGEASTPAARFHHEILRFTR
jgi:hypothetical protein